jgi:RHS repeat-associated protein
VMFDPGAAGALPAVRHGYCGYVEDRATGLWLARFRWYDADTGRWIQRDPAGYVDGMGLYEYVQSQTITLVDPMGLDGCDLKQDRYLRARGVLSTRAEDLAAREAERQARLTRLRKDGISTTDDFIFWYYNGRGQAIHVSDKLLEEFRSHELVKPVIDKLKKDAIKQAAESISCEGDCRVGESKTTTNMPTLFEFRTTVKGRSSCLGNPARNTYSYGKGSLKADASCRVTVVDCGSSSKDCNQKKLKVRCNISFHSDDMFAEPLALPREYGGDVGGTPYWFTTRWVESREETIQCPSSQGTR